MDSEDLRSMLVTAGVDIWSLMDAAIAMASVDHGGELKRRRDGIVERLYAGSSVQPPCRNCNADADASEIMTQSSPSAVEEKDPYGSLLEQKKILEITEQLEDPNQTEDSLVELLQNLADMDITFQALQATDIGRHVNQLRKHSSNDVRRLVKLLVRKWKEIVDEWVDLKAPGEPGSVVMGDEDSPQQKILQNGDRQIPDFASSPNPHSGSSGSERNNTEPQLKPKAVPRKEVIPRPLPSVTTQNRQRESNFDSDRFASARKRLQENYKDVANAKKQRTIQVMDLHELPKPKPKNPFFGKSKGGSSQGRH